MTEPNTIDWQETLTGEMLRFSLIGRIVYTYPKNEERPWLQSLIDDEVFSENLNVQREFLKEHLGAWAMTWFGLVEKHARMDFYKGLAHLTRKALSSLSEVLDVNLTKETAR